MPLVPAHQLVAVDVENAADGAEVVVRQVDAEGAQAVAQLVKVQHAVTVVVHAVEYTSQSADAVEAARGGDAGADAVHGGADLGGGVRVGLGAHDEGGELAELERVRPVQVVPVEEGAHLALDAHEVHGGERGLELVEGDDTLAAGVEFLKVQLQLVRLRGAGVAWAPCEAAAGRQNGEGRCAKRACLPESVKPLLTSILRRSRASRSSVSSSSVPASMARGDSGSESGREGNGLRATLRPFRGAPLGSEARC